MQPEPLAESQIEELCNFLASIFGVTREAPFLHPGLMRWKYFEPVEGWTGPRSWVLRDGGRIVAHCGIWPLWYEHEGTLLQAQHLIDWAASRATAGAGVWIYTALARKLRLSLTIGGSSEARPVLPRIGFREIGRQQVWARPLRPWRQAWNRRRIALWKRAALLGRNWLWSLHPPRLASEWRSVEVDLPDFPPGRSNAQFTALARPAGWYAFLKRCPTVRTSFYRIERAGRPCGSFVLARMGAQARLVDWHIEPAGPEAWRAVLSLAIAAAHSDTGAHELMTAASFPELEEVLAGAGFRPRAEKPIFTSDREGLLTNRPPLQAHMADADAFFLYSEGEAYIT